MNTINLSINWLTTLSERYDQKAVNPLQFALFILADKHDGAYHLARHLQSLDFGVATEYFRPDILRAQEGSTADYTRSLVGRRTASSGIFSALIGLDRLGHLPIDEILKEIGKEPKFILLRRRQILDSALALYAAVQSGRVDPIGGDAGTSTAIAAPDLQVLRFYLARAGQVTGGAAQFIERRKLSPLEVVYDELLEDSNRVLRKIADFVGVAYTPSSEREKIDGAYRGCETQRVQSLVDGVQRTIDARKKIKAPSFHKRRLERDNPKRIAVVMMVKDEEDIIFSHLTWHFAQGLRQFVILDNMSSDGTRGEIERFIRVAEPLGARVLQVDDREIGYYQSDKMTAAANLAQTYFGAEWILALDSDEFLSLGQLTIFALLDRVEKKVEQTTSIAPSSPLFLAAVRFLLFNYVCTPVDDVGESTPILRLAYRRPKGVPGKTAAFWSPDLTFAQGNHHVIIGGGRELLPAYEGSAFGANIRHFPVRSFSHFLKKVRNGGRAYEATNLSPTSGRHWREWYQILKTEGEAGLRTVFEGKFLAKPSELKLDPLPRVMIGEDRIYLERTRQPSERPAEVALHGHQMVSIGGKGFAPEMISLTAPPTPKPIFLRWNTSDILAFFQIFVRGEYDIALSPAPSYIVDLGANVGLAAAYFLGRYPDATVVCVEPSKANFEILTKNLEGYSTAKAILSAAWPESTTLEVVSTNDAGEALGFWGMRTKPASAEQMSSSSTERVQGVSIGDIMRRFELPRIDLLKVDIEGAELELFSRNTQEWLPFVTCIVIETHDRFRPGTTAAVKSALGSAFEESRSGENWIFKRIAGFAHDSHVAQ
jgi:FkbM family methyltransferase